jgi:Right handed beta helix region
MQANISHYVLRSLLPHRQCSGLDVFVLLSILILTIVAFVSPINAAILYVDKDNRNCSDWGQGITIKPFCSIKKAASVAKAGDTIRVRNASTAYNEFIMFARGGTSDTQRIILEPDIFHRPILTKTGTPNQWGPGLIDIKGKSYITIRNLYFRDVRATNAIRSVNPDLKNNPSGSTGIVIAGNIFDGGGPSGPNHVNGQYSAMFIRNNKNTIIRNNEVVNWRGAGIQLQGNNTHLLIEGNEIHRLKCVKYYNGIYKVHGIFTGQSDTSPRLITFQSNHIHNLGGCDANAKDIRYMGIHLDGQYGYNILQDNIIHDIAYHGGYGIGIHLEDNSSNNIC